MYITSTGDRSTHRSSRTAVDSGNTPSAWGDAPSAFNDMPGYNVLRMVVIVNSGTLTGLTVRPITIDGSNIFPSEPTVMAINANGVSPADFAGFAGMQNVYMKIEAIAGTTPNISIVLQGVQSVV